MKIQHRTSKQIIDVPSEHANMLMTQGWTTYKEIENEEEVKRQGNRQEEVLKQRGRPKKSF